MTYSIHYCNLIDWKRLSKLSAKDKRRLKEAIEQKLMTRPELFGKPLRQSLTGCRSLRVGDYRVIYRIVGNTVEIQLFGHRSTIYSDADTLL